MFVVSVKTDRRRLGMASVCAVLVLSAILVAVLVPVPHATSTAVGVSNARDRALYLSACGVTVDETCEDVREVRLPDEADETVAQYNALQEAVGQSLEPYYGKRVRLYSYSAVSESGDGTAHLYVYQDRVVAADMTVNGETRALTKP